MRYIRSIASRPGLFENIALDLDADISIIYGKNASGKSLLARAFIDGIWRMCSGPVLIDKTSWESLFLELTVNHEDNIYRFTNNSSRNFSITEIKENIPEKIFTDEHHTLERWREGIPELNEHAEIQDLYLSITRESLHQWSLMPSQTDFDTLPPFDYGAIRSLIISDESGFFALYRKLSSLFKKEDENNVLTEEIEKKKQYFREVNKKIQLIEIQHSRIDKLKKEKNILIEEILTLKNNIETLERKKSTLISIGRNLKDIEKLRKQYNEIEETLKDEQKLRKAIKSKTDEIEDKFPHFKKLKKIKPGNLDILQEKFNFIKEINSRIHCKNEKNKKYRKTLKRIFIALSCLAISAAATLLYIKKMELETTDIIFLSFTAGGYSVISAILLLIYFINKKAQNTDSLLKEKSMGERDLSEMIAGESTLDGTGQDDLFHFLSNYFEDYIEFLESTRELHSMKKRIQNPVYLEEIRTELERLKEEDTTMQNEIDRYSAEFDKKQGITLDPGLIESHVIDIDEEISEIKTIIKQKQELIEQIDDEITKTPTDIDRRDSYVNERSAIENELRKLERNKQSLYYILDTLEESIKTTEERQLRKFLNLTLDKFHYLTGNQHISIINETMLENLLRGEGKHPDIKQPLYYTLILAFKLSLTPFLEKSGHLIPLIIDEPFLYMDSERTSRFKELVLDISSSRQIIIFTHSEGKNDWGKFNEL